MSANHFENIPAFVHDDRSHALALIRREKPGWVWERRRPEAIRGVTVHHSAGHASWEATLRAAAIRGVRAANVPFSYHFAIEPGGAIHYTNDILCIVYHNGGTLKPDWNKPWSQANDETIGVVLLGDFVQQSEGPGWLQREAFRQLWGWLVDGPAFELTGHQEWKATECPGTNWFAWKWGLIAWETSGSSRGGRTSELG